MWLRHIGVVVQEIGAAGALWTGDGGLRMPYGLRSVPSLGLTQAMLPVDSSAAVELIEPQAQCVPVAEALRSGRGLFHLSFAVDDLEAAIERAALAGAGVVRIPSLPTYPFPFAFVDASSAHGVWLELMEIRPGAQVPDEGVAGAAFQGVHHFGHVVDDVEATAGMYERVLGLAVDERTVAAYRTVSPQRGPHIRLLPSHGWAAPTDNLAGRCGPGLAYIALSVADLPATTAALRERGYWIRLDRDSVTGQDATWILPHAVGGLSGASLGALVLLVQVDEISSVQL